MKLAGLALVFLAASCAKAGPDPEEEARQLLVDTHRALIVSRSFVRFGELGLFEQEMDKIPCRVALSEANRECEVVMVGKGPVRMRVAGPELQRSGVLRKDALIWIEYQADCDNERYDFKVVDHSLPRLSSGDGATVWESKLVRVTHRRQSATPKDHCTLTIEAAPALLERIRAVGEKRRMGP